MSDNESTSNTPDNSAEDSESDAFNSASESLQMYSVRKRKTAGSRTASQSEFKRSKSLYNDDYRAMFNSTVNELTRKQSSMTDHRLQQSQIGVTLWSSEEKAAFFHALARKGRHDIRGIATDVGTKNESEVYVYSDMLQKATVEQQTYCTRKSLLDTSSLEAALEVQESCCAALDLAADALSALQQNEEEKDAKKKHKDLALLTPRIARWIEHRMAVPEGGKKEIIEQIPAATILNLVNFLALSKRFFMNSVVAEDNWRSYTGRRTKSPSIMYTAFSDFHTLLISVTQRLVQSTLFFARSRLRAMSGSRPRLHVRQRDVIAAINVLGMKIDAKMFWARAARKCKLRVYDRVRHRQVFGKRYSYTALEKILSPSMFSNDSDADSPGMSKHSSTSGSGKGPSQRDLSVSALDDSISLDSMSVDGGRSNALSNDENLSGNPLHFITDVDNEHEGHEELQDAYAEALDQQASCNEERRLWEMLGKDPAEKKEPANVKLPKDPFPTRKTEDELLDWSKLIDYADDWEKLETPVFESSFASDPGFTEDVDLASGLISSGPSSESLVYDVISEADHKFAFNEDANSEGATKSRDAYASSSYDTKHGAKTDDSGAN